MEAALGYILHLNTPDFLTDSPLVIDNPGIKKKLILFYSRRKNPAGI
jgi:hypothetical protein